MSDTPPTLPASNRPASPRGGLEPAPGEWKGVSPRYVVVDLIGTIVTGALVTAGTGLPWFLSRVEWLIVFPIVVAVIAILVAAFTPRRVRSIGYRLRDDDLLFRRGILFQRFVAVPYGRMQLVDITRGPLDRALGLATLKLVTAAASSSVAVPGLPLEDAESLRDSLVDLAESRRAGL